MRIALVHSFYSSDEPSGENEQVRAELNALDRSGANVKLFAASTDNLREGFGYRSRAAVRVATGRGRSPLDAIAEFQPHVVHIHNLFPNYGRHWVTKLEAPVVTTVHNFRFVCAAATLFRDGRVCTDCPDGHRWAGLRHRCYRQSAAATLPLTVYLRKEAATDPVFARSDRILCLSVRQRSLLEIGGIPTDRLVDWANFVPRDVLRGEQSRTRGSRPRNGCLYVGRLSPGKGCLELVRRWDSTDLLRIVGEGPQLAELRAAAAGKQIEFVGHLARPEVLDLMRLSSVLVIPSIAPEGSSRPLVYLEALACGLPTVVTRTSDVAEQVQHDGAGGIAEDIADIPATAGRVAADPTQSDRCTAVYESRFSGEAWTARVLSLYRSLER